MIKDDGEVIHFNNPKVQASLSANTFAVTGHAEIKRKFIYILLQRKHFHKAFVVSSVVKCGGVACCMAYLCIINNLLFVTCKL